MARAKAKAATEPNVQWVQFLADHAPNTRNQIVQMDPARAFELSKRMGIGERAGSSGAVPVVELLSEDVAQQRMRDAEAVLSALRRKETRVVRFLRGGAVAINNDTINYPGGATAAFEIRHLFDSKTGRPIKGGILDPARPGGQMAELVEGEGRPAPR